MGPLQAEIGTTLLQDLPFSSVTFGKLVRAVVTGQITGNMGKDVLSIMMQGISLEEILQRSEFQVSSDNELESFVDEVIANSPEQVQQVKDKPESLNKLTGWFVGQVMKASQGKANAGEAKKLFIEKLNEA